METKDVKFFLQIIIKDNYNTNPYFSYKVVAKLY